MKRMILFGALILAAACTNPSAQNEAPVNDDLQATEDFERKELIEIPNNYDIWFTHNYNKVFMINPYWKSFL